MCSFIVALFWAFFTEFYFFSIFYALFASKEVPFCKFNSCSCSAQFADLPVNSFLICFIPYKQCLGL